MALNRLQYLLTKLAEESMEVGQIALKAQHFGLHEKQSQDTPTNRKRVHAELNDLNAIIGLLNAECGFGYHATDIKNQLAMLDKVEKVEHYYKYSKVLGTVE